MKRQVGMIWVITVLPIVAVAGLLWTMRAPAAAAFEPPALGGVPQDPELRKGYEVFTGKGCVYCHGPEGKGGVKNPNAMGGEVPAIKPQNFTYEEFEEKLEVGVRLVDSADSTKPAPPLYMPSWKGKLTADEFKALWAYLSSLAPKGSGGDEW